MQAISTRVLGQNSGKRNQESRETLEKEYNIVEASNGREALDIIKNEDDPTRIHLIITDQRMPELTGVELLEQSYPIIPQTMRMILTAFTDVDVIVDAGPTGIEPTTVLDLTGGDVQVLRVGRGDVSGLV